MRSRQQFGTKLTLLTVWDQVQTGYMVTSGAGVENVTKDIRVQLLTDPKPVGRKGPVEEMGVAEMRQELAEARDTIIQLCKIQEPNKRQRRDEWQRSNRWKDRQGSDQQGLRTSVAVPEGNGKAVKASP